VFAAVEGAAEERAAVVDGAAGGAEVDAGSVGGGEEVDGVAVAVGAGLVLVGVDVVTLFGVEEEALIAAAAEGAGIAGDGGFARDGHVFIVGFGWMWGDEWRKRGRLAD